MGAYQYQAYLESIPDGPAGVRATLKEMARFVRKAKADPQFVLFARSLVRHLPPKAYKAEAIAIHNFVRDKIRYVKDPRGVETIAEPKHTLRIGQGDCDDKSILSAALFEALGHPARFVAVGFSPGHFSHVFTQTKIGQKWITSETTEPWPFGKNGPRPVSIMIETI